MTPHQDPENAPAHRTSLPVSPAPWARLVLAARQAPPAAEVDDAAPFGFSTRLVARWRQAREEERRLALWQRLSWRAALGSLALCGLVVIASPGGTGGSDRPLLEPPAIVFPGL